MRCGTERSAHNERYGSEGANKVGVPQVFFFCSGGSFWKSGDSTSIKEAVHAECSAHNERYGSEGANKVGVPRFKWVSHGFTMTNIP